MKTLGNMISFVGGWSDASETRMVLEEKDVGDSIEILR